jgi:hypothetical protein
MSFMAQYCGLLVLVDSVHKSTPASDAALGLLRGCLCAA